MPQSYNNVQTRDYPQALDAPFRVAETFGPQPFAHNYLDAVRMNWRRTPEATYPDGYLGTIPSRRGDRLLDGLKARQTNRPYTRGVHKGERLDQRDYFWPPEFNLWSGLENEEKGLRWAPPNLENFLEYERYPTDRNHQGPRSVAQGARYAKDGAQTAVGTTPDRVSTLRSQAPGWATGVRGNPGMAVPYPGR
jgi:hypothetical protein